MKRRNFITSLFVMAGAIPIMNLFRKKHLVLIADGKPDSDGDVLRKEAVEIKESLPLLNPWSLNENTIAGEAGKVFWIGNRLYMSDVKFYGDKPEFMVVHPAIVGNLKKTKKVGGKRIIEKCSIIGVMTSFRENADPRIPEIIFRYGRAV